MLISINTPHQAQGHSIRGEHASSSELPLLDAVNRLFRIEEGGILVRLDGALRKLLAERERF